MTKYNAHKNDEPVTAVTLDGKEYKAKDGIIEIPEDHHAAHTAALATGLTVHSDHHEGAEKPHNTTEPAAQKAQTGKSHR